jgi:hypothetical protein
MKDWRGIEVKVGDQVLYASRTGSTMELVEGTVIAFVGDKARVQVVRRSGYGYQETVTLTNRYITVVTLPESSTQTLQQSNHEKAVRLAELEAKQNACDHAVKEHRNLFRYSYWRCVNCDKSEYTFTGDR